MKTTIIIGRYKPSLDTLVQTFFSTKLFIFTAENLKPCFCDNKTSSNLMY